MFKRHKACPKGISVYDVKNLTLLLQKSEVFSLRFSKCMDLKPIGLSPRGR
jgi:hypothetical protein